MKLPAPSATDHMQATHSNPAPSEPAAAHLSPAGKGKPARILNSQTLLGGENLVLIVHQGETYRLQTTRQGKLILTK